MDIFEYKVEKIDGVFAPRATKFVRLQTRCTELGKQGWELVSVNYDWFTVTYTMFFKRAQSNKAI
jgi:hypothetical protein